jgi:fructosamine-3-kinase
MKFSDTDALKFMLETEVGISITSLLRVANPGEVNDVFILDTAGSQLIARVNEIGEIDRFKKEKWCIEEAMNAGILVPTVTAVGNNADYAYLLESYIKGSRADKLEDASGVWSRIGQYAKNIHSINVKGFGENLENITHGNHDEWNKYLGDNLDALENGDKALTEASHLTATDIETLLGWLKELKDKDFQFGLSHGDLSLKNVIVSENGDVNLIDWGAAEAQVVPHYDLGVILEDSLRDDSEDFGHVLQGYEMTYDEYLNIKPDLLTIMLLITVDKLRWSIVKRPELVTDMSTNLRKCFESRRALIS